MQNTGIIVQKTEKQHINRCKNAMQHKHIKENDDFEAAKGACKKMRDLVNGAIFVWENTQGKNISLGRSREISQTTSEKHRFYVAIATQKETRLWYNIDSASTGFLCADKIEIKSTKSVVCGGLSYERMRDGLY